MFLKTKLYTTAHSWLFGNKYILSREKTLGGTLKNDSMNLQNKKEG